MRQTNLILKTIIGIIFIISFIVIIGWVFDIVLFKSIVPEFVTMKFSTAVAFLISGIILLNISQILKESSLKSKITIFSSIILLVFMTYLLITSILGIDTEIGNLIIKEAPGAAKTVNPGLPSIATMICFILISLAGFLSFSKYQYKISKIIAEITFFLGFISLLGYILNRPKLYFYIEGISNGMALSTAFLFMIIGIGIYIISRNETNNESTSVGDRIFLGFFIIILLIIVMVGILSQINSLRIDKTNQIKDVEAPLNLMVEQVKGYDALMTNNAHEALLHAEIGDNSDFKKHKLDYSETGIKLDNLLKIEAINLLEKSNRPTESKEKVKEILKKLDKVNLVLVDLEIGTFNALEKGDIEKARLLIVSKEYEDNKIKLKGLFEEWGRIEQEVSSNTRNQIIQEANLLSWVNLFFSIIIIVLAIITSIFIANSIAKPIKKLKDDVDEISKGKLEIKLEKSNITEIQSLIDSLSRILATMKLVILRSGLSKIELGIGEAVKAKEQAEKKYERLYNSSSDALMVLEPPTWKFTHGNPATIKMFKVRDEKELISLFPWELSPKYQPDGQLSAIKAKKMIEKAMREGKAFFEWTHKRYLGENFPATVLLSKVSDGEKTYLQATVRDISQEKEIEERIIKSEAFKNAVLDNSPDCMKIIDLKGRLVYMNKGGLIEHGFKKPEDAIGWNWINSIEISQRREVIKNFKESIRTGKTISMEVKHIKGKSNREWCNFTIVPMKDQKGRVINILGISRDISKERKEKL